MIIIKKFLFIVIQRISTFYLHTFRITVLQNQN